MAPDGTAFVAALVVPPYTSPRSAVPPARAGARSPGAAGHRLRRRRRGDDPARLVVLPVRHEARAPADGRLRYADQHRAARHRRGNRDLASPASPPTASPDPALGPGGVRALGRLSRARATLASDPVRPAAARRGRAARAPRDRLVAAWRSRPTASAIPRSAPAAIARIPLPFEADGPAVARARERRRGDRDDAAGPPDAARPWRSCGGTARSAAASAAGGFATIGGFEPARPTVVYAAAIDGLDRLVLGGESGDGLSRTSARTSGATTWR